MPKALLKKRVQAVKLRKQEMSYSQIKTKLGVSKSTLSLWLRKYPLPEEVIYELQHSDRRIERFRNTMKKKRDTRLGNVYKKEKGKLLPLTRRELYIAGLLLYWGEGGKTQQSMVSLSNTNPKILKLYIYWLTKIFGVRKKNLKARLHIYADMNEKEAIRYWSKALGLSGSQFNKTYVKKTTLKSLSYKGLGKGTCNIIVGSRDIYERIMMGIRVIGDFFETKM